MTQQFIERKPLPGPYSYSRFNVKVAYTFFVKRISDGKYAPARQVIREAHLTDYSPYGNGRGYKPGPSRYEVLVTEQYQFCREHATRELYNRATKTKAKLKMVGMVPVCSPSIVVNNKTIFSSGWTTMTRPVKGPAINLVEGLAYIMLMRGVADEEVRIKTLKPAKETYKSNSYPIPSGVIPVIPPVFCSLLLALHRMSYAAEHDTNCKFLYKIAGTTPKKVVEVINTFNVKEAERIYFELFPYLVSLNTFVGVTPFSTPATQPKLVKLLKEGVKSTVKRPLIAGDYKDTGRYSYGINAMLRNQKAAWVLK